MGLYYELEKIHLTYGAAIHFPKRQFLDPSKLHELADDNSKFDEKGGKVFEVVENTGGKGEIARHEQFLLPHSVFKGFVLQTRKTKGLFGIGTRVNDGEGKKTF